VYKRGGGERPHKKTTGHNLSRADQTKRKKPIPKRKELPVEPTVKNPKALTGDESQRLKHKNNNRT